jgi:hypothetical protein
MENGRRPPRVKTAVIELFGNPGLRARFDAKITEFAADGGKFHETIERTGRLSNKFL